ncbi:MAG: hypothetical protein D6737_08280 [Chloroflexi bacterium]|nr:MAG: hypothetical protein CUN54_03665 [Phototrophicales bacterium]RMF80368.1 MAG: hypothetical protein D6737_08280 [Chloroflexota bacterium]
MNNRGNLLGLAVLFVILSVVAILQSQNPNNEGTTPPTPNIRFQRVFPNLTVLEITAIQLELPASGQRFTMRRGSDGLWENVENNAVLGREQATDIAQTIVLLPYQESVPINEQTNLDDFGFDKPPRLLIQALLNNSENHIVAIGDLTTTQRQYYAIVDEIELIYLLERGPIEFLINQVESLQET